jgi:hypothetical protein
LCVGWSGYCAHSLLSVCFALFACVYVCTCCCTPLPPCSGVRQVDSDEEWEQDVDGESVDRSDGSEEEEEEEEEGGEGEPNKDALDYEDGWLCEDNYVECVTLCVCGGWVELAAFGGGVGMGWEAVTMSSA